MTQDPTPSPHPELEGNTPPSQAPKPKNNSRTVLLGGLLTAGLIAGGYGLYKVLNPAPVQESNIETPATAAQKSAAGTEEKNTQTPEDAEQTPKTEQPSAQGGNPSKTAKSETVIAQGINPPLPETLPGGGDAIFRENPMNQAKNTPAQKAGAKNAASTAQTSTTKITPSMASVAVPNSPTPFAPPVIPQVPQAAQKQTGRAPANNAPKAAQSPSNVAKAPQVIIKHPIPVPTLPQVPKLPQVTLSTAPVPTAGSANELQVNTPRQSGGKIIPPIRVPSTQKAELGGVMQGSAVTVPAPRELKLEPLGPQSGAQGGGAQVERAPEGYGELPEYVTALKLRLTARQPLHPEENTAVFEIEGREHVRMPGQEIGGMLIVSINERNAVMRDAQGREYQIRIGDKPVALGLAAPNAPRPKQQLPLDAAPTGASTSTPEDPQTPVPSSAATNSVQSPVQSPDTTTPSIPGGPQ